MKKKHLKRKRFGMSKRTAYDSVMDELNFTKQMKHPNVIWLEEIIEDEENIYLVTDYYAQDSLGGKMRKLNSDPY